MTDLKKSMIFLDFLDILAKLFDHVGNSAGSLSVINGAKVPGA
jgi:hypothetical protein